MEMKMKEMEMAMEMAMEMDHIEKAQPCGPELGGRGGGV